MDDFKLAWRNVWRNTRRSVVTIAATSLALFVMIVYTGLVAGYIAGLEKNILDLETGDAQAYAEGYRDKPSIYATIDQPEAMAADLREAGYRVAGRLLGTGLGAGQDSSSGVQLIGVDVVHDATVTTIAQHLRRGVWLEPQDQGVVLGWRLAESLGLDLGEELVVLSQGADGSMANEVYPVRGILESISDNVDRSGVFMTQAEYRELMMVEAGVHQMIIRIPAGADLAAATAAAQGLASEGAKVESWKQIKPSLSSMLEASAGAMAVMGAIVYIAVGIVILNAMLMAVFERIRELGVLKAIGFTPLEILKLIFVETGIQTTVAVGVGVLVALPVNAYMVNTGVEMGNVSVMGVAWDPVWHSLVTVETYTKPAISLIVIVALAVTYPALRAAFIRPLDAIRD